MTELVVVPYALKTQSPPPIMDDMQNYKTLIQTTNFQLAMEMIIYVIMSNAEEYSLSNN